MWQEIARGLLEGIVSGIILAITGYLKKVGENGKMEEFEWTKFLATVIIGAIAGILMKTLGLEFSEAMNLLVIMGITVLVENVVKTIVRQYWRMKICDEAKFVRNEDVLSMFMDFMKALDMRSELVLAGYASQGDERTYLAELADKYEAYLKRLEQSNPNARNVRIAIGDKTVVRGNVPKILRSGGEEAKLLIKFFRSLKEVE